MIDFIPKRKQQGVVLVFSLVLLVALTLIGVTAMQNARTELAMAGNQREAGLMFHAAEIGLVIAERAAEDIIVGDFPDGTKGYYRVEADNPDYQSPEYYTAAKWETSSSLPSPPIQGVDADQQPRFIVEYLGIRDSNPLNNGNIQNQGGNPSGNKVATYRITSRGSGLTGNSFRYLQTYYGKAVE